MEDKSIKEYLEEERKRLLRKLGEVPVGSNEAKAIINDLMDLSTVANNQQKLEIDEEKLKFDHDLAIEKHKDDVSTEKLKIESNEEMEKLKIQSDHEKQAMELANKEQDRKEAKKQRRWQTALQFVGFGVTIGLSVFDIFAKRKDLGTLLHFEETGNYIASSGGKFWLPTIFRKK